MADCELVSSIFELKNTKIPVDVVDVIHDIIVVTYGFGNKYFQGVLLDSTKKNMPLGINPPGIVTDGKEDILPCAINQRFTYFQNITPVNGVKKIMNKRNKNNRGKPDRMTIRLRPRQVLCSNCKSICNENSDNIDKIYKQNIPEKDLRSNSLDRSGDASHSVELPSVIERSPRSLLTEKCKNYNYQLRNRNAEPSDPNNTLFSLVPKLPRLKPTEITNAINGKLSPKLTVINGNLYIRSPTYPIVRSSDGGVENQFCIVNVSSVPIETPLDNDIEADSNFVKDTATVDEEDPDNKMVLHKKPSVGSMEDLWDESAFEEKKRKARTTPVLKISFGSQGQGTVLKIPSKVSNASESTEEEDDHYLDEDLKAVKKAHKKAKKLAKRKMCSMSPIPPPADEHNRKRRKVKHRKKRRKESNIPSTNDDAVLIDDDDDNNDNSQATEKLSISLRRLNDNAYTTHPGQVSNTNSRSGSSDEIEPNFPEMCAIFEPVHTERTFFTTTAGEIVKIGDIIWGKAQGCAWWPGKVTTFKMSASDHSLYAHVSWYGSTTSSLMSCDNLCPFLDTYKSCFNKHKKSGQYKEAIRQATYEAEQLKMINCLDDISSVDGDAVRML